MIVKDEIIGLLTETKRKGIDNVIRQLVRGGFFTAPASVSYHNNCEGGLAKHSLDVYKHAIDEAEYQIQMDQMPCNRLQTDSLTLCALLHDVCKMDEYCMRDGKPHHTPEYYRNKSHRHGTKSVELLEGWELELTEDEKMAIKCHMGMHTRDMGSTFNYSTEAAKTPLVAVIHTADSKSAKTPISNTPMNNTDRRQINRSVMQDTVQQYENITSLRNAIDVSLTCQYMVSEDEVIDVERVEHSHNTYLCTPRRTLEAAKNYAGKRVAVLNFANNHSVGGAPFSAGAQEESMCRCSTLYPCLQAMEKVFYVKHQNLFAAHKIGFMGNDDIIYTHQVVVFKTDKREKIIRPVMMPEEEWYKVDVITCAAPELNKMRTIPADYETQMRKRIRRILEVAAREKVEVLILGKWGCGAFANPEEVVARLFYEELEHYEFGIVEFALGGDEPDSPFNTYSPQPSKTEAIDILKALSDSTTGFPSELERRRFGRALGLGGPLGDKNFNE